MLNDDFDIDYYINQQNEDAEKEINTLLEKSNVQNLSVSDYYSLYSNYKLIQKKSEYKEEIEKYKNIIKQMMSDNSVTYTAEEYSCLSYVYYDEKNYEKCFYYINLALEIEPNNADLYLLKGEFYRHIGKSKLSKIEYAKAININPELKNIIQHLIDADKAIAGTKQSLCFAYLIIGGASLFLGYFIIQFIITTIHIFHIIN